MQITHISADIFNWIGVRKKQEKRTEEKPNKTVAYHRTHNQTFEKAFHSFIHRNHIVYLIEIR